MANLKELKTRISSVKSTQKITSAMKMVAASRLKRAQEAAESARPYAERIGLIISSVIEYQGSLGEAPRMLVGSKADQNHLLVVVTSDRGLCGGFNSNISREARNRIRELQVAGKTVKLICIGRKGRDQLKREFSTSIIKTYEGFGRKGIKYSEAKEVANHVIAMFEGGEFDVCTVIYNRFVSAITQVVTPQQIIPVQLANDKEGVTEDDQFRQVGELSAIYEFEPTGSEVLAELLPENITFQLFRALLESSASEHGARMSAMDNATRNAGEMIDGLTLTFNRTRQAKITSELIEIISGAEAL